MGKNMEHEMETKVVICIGVDSNTLPPEKEPPHPLQTLNPKPLNPKQ